MYRFISFLLIFLSVNVGHARNISGIVLSSKDSTAVAGAKCVLIDDSKIISATETDGTGKFMIVTSGLPGESLKIEMASFDPLSIRLYGERNVDLGKLFLDESITLGEVVVTANQVVHSEGKTIVYPSSSDIKSSSTSISLFQKLPLPGLEANPVNRSISVDGGSPMILINGIPSTIGDFNALNPKDIDKVEYSRFTPARYADKGVNGLLSIVLKKRTDGGQVYAWGRSAVTTAFVDANIRASYHQGASQFTLSYSPSWRNYQDVYDFIDESYIGNDFRVDLKETDRNPFNYFDNQIRFKYDYSPSERTLFSATFRANPFTNKGTIYGEAEDSMLGDYSYTNMNKGRNFTPSLDLFFRQDFNGGNSLEAQVVGTLSSNKYLRDNRYFFENLEDQSYIVDVDSKRRSLITEIIYSHTFNGNATLSGGIQNTLSHARNRYVNSDYEPILTENNNYIYARYGQRFGKVYLSVATGLKLFWIKNDLNRRRFIKNLSSAQLSWNISQQWNIAGSFQYSPSIPSLSSLTDYPQQSSPYLISNGNPDLKVTDYFKYRISASYQYKKFSASLYTAYRTWNNSVMQDLTYLGDGMFLSQSINAREMNSFSSSLSMKLSQIKGFGVNLYMDLSHYHCADESWSHNLTSFSGSISLWWNHGPFTVSYWYKLPGKYMSGHYIGKDENGNALSFEYAPNKHWNFGIDWMYMFDKKGTRYPSWDYSTVNPATRDRYIKNNGNMITLSVTYQADFGTLFKTARRSLNNTDGGSSLLRL